MYKCVILHLHSCTYIYIYVQCELWKTIKKAQHLCRLCSPAWIVHTNPAHNPAHNPMDRQWVGTGTMDLGQGSIDHRDEFEGII